MSSASVRRVVACLTVAAGASCAIGQVCVLVTDRTSNKVWRATDADHDGSIDASSAVELLTYFDATNASGILGPANPNALGYGGGLALIGDQDSLVGRRWTWARDLNGDGDALDTGESGVWCDATNAGGFSFAFPTGVAFGPSGQIALVNASNSFGADDVFLVHDGVGDPADGDVNDAGEITRFVTINGFGTSGSYSPQEVAFDNAGVLYLHNSSGSLHGIYRLSDGNATGKIDAASEMTLFFGATNASGITPSAGFDVCVDPVRARSFYYWQIASGGNDQLLRVRDINGDGDAMDAGEAEIVYSTAETGFTSIDSIALKDGSVLISDNSGNRVFRLVDTDGDGLFSSAGERTPFIASGLTSARAMSLVHDVGCSDADLGRQGGILGGDGLLDNNDFVVFINLFFAGAPASDVGRQGGLPGGDGVLDNNDFAVFINLFFAGCA